MATYEYARILLTSSEDTSMTVKIAVGVPADDGLVEGMEVVDALNRLGERGWRPLQMQNLSGTIKDAKLAEAWHLVRSSDDKLSG